MPTIKGECTLPKMRRFLWRVSDGRVPQEYVKDFMAFPESSKIVIVAGDKETVQRDGDKSVVRVFEPAMIHYKSQSGKTNLTWTSRRGGSVISGKASDNAISRMVRSGIIPTPRNIRR